MRISLRETISANRAGAIAALPGVCTAHEDALRASFLLAEQLDRTLIVEATSNQVDQHGGYSGLRPDEFVAHAARAAESVGCDPGRAIYGGDHLGPQAWRGEPAESAMSKARELVAAYAAAGFAKLHLDCSEGCAGEPQRPGDAVCAARSAELAAIAMAHAPDPGALDIAVGTEVPPPGGSRDGGRVSPTTPDAARATLAAHVSAFGDAAERIACLVVQPGAEFSAWDVDHLPDTPNAGLRAVLEDREGLCFEAHSTDHQRPEALSRLAETGFAVLKVGPALTFAWREAIYALDVLADMMLGEARRGPSVRETAERVMLAEPGRWRSHCHGDETERRLQRHFGLADRIRYYWRIPALAEAAAALRSEIADAPLRRPILGQVFAREVVERAEAVGHVARDPADALLLASVQTALLPYFLGDGR